MGHHLDQRIINTKQDLYSGLFSLIKKNVVIKVTDICNEANVTPMTFYHHYGDKTQLIEDAIKDQLSLRLPIPVKLKPHTLKQLIYYLIRFLSEFSTNNKELILAAIQNCNNKGLKNSYLDILVKTINFYINKELQIILSDLQPITINIIADIVVSGLMYLFFKRISHNKPIDYELIKMNLQQFNNIINM